MKGANLRIKVKLTLEEVAEGVNKKVKVFKQVQAAGVEHSDCSTCHGTGQVRRVTNTILGQMQTSSTCPDCHGTGQRITRKPSGTDELGMKREEAIVTLDIPAGVEDGMQLSVRGEGNGAPLGGVAGDLIVLVRCCPTTPSSATAKPTTTTTSLCGRGPGVHRRGSSLGGKAKIKVDAGTQSGKLSGCAARACRRWTATAMAT